MAFSENVPGLKAVEHKLGIVSPAAFIQNTNSMHERVSCVVAPIHSNKTDFKPISTWLQDFLPGYLI